MKRGKVGLRRIEEGKGYPMNRPNPGYLYLTSQRISSPALKAEMARRYPDLRFSYSRPGFQTYVLPESFRSPSGTGERLARRVEFDIPSMKLVFARSRSRSLGKVLAENSSDDSSPDISDSS